MTQEDIERLTRRGKAIATRLGEEVVYEGPQMMGNIFVYHVFTDRVTGSSFAGRTLFDSQAGLMATRARHMIPAPPFPDIPDPVSVVKRLEDKIGQIIRGITRP